MPRPTDLPVWPLLREQRENMKGFSLRGALASESRTARLFIEGPGVVFDFSKHLVGEETLSLLFRLAEESGLPRMREALFTGEKINTSEGRAALHTALRADENERILVDGEDVMDFVRHSLSRTGAFAEQVRSGEHRGYTGQAILDVVNIGIGGSDLGPRFVTEALADHHDGPRVHFLSNVDGNAAHRLLRQVSPETTLFIIASKTFTTEETMQNAATAREWFLRHAPSSALSGHFVALSSNTAGAAAFGIEMQQIFPFKDWVGGRFSLWSSIALPVMIAVGGERFAEFLSGARAMDKHFRDAPQERNIPLLMALLGVWYRNFWGYPAHMILPYDERLQKIAKFVQQMDMESNGKSMDRDGHQADYETGALIFGEPGTDCQHSFMQLVHQGTTPIPADFIICRRVFHPFPEHHRVLAAHFLAQTRALALGQTPEEAEGKDPFRVFPGNRPTTSIVLSELSPFCLGSLIAAYEHKVFVQGVIWNLNSFDQPGVELGKKLAAPLRKGLGTGEGDVVSLDSSTRRLMEILGGEDGERSGSPPARG